MGAKLDKDDGAKLALVMIGQNAIFSDKTLEEHMELAKNEYCIEEVIPFLDKGVFKQAFLDKLNELGFTIKDGE